MNRKEALKLLGSGLLIGLLTTQSIAIHKEPTLIDNLKELCEENNIEFIYDTLILENKNRDTVIVYTKDGGLRWFNFNELYIWQKDKLINFDKKYLFDELNLNDIINYHKEDKIKLFCSKDEEISIVVVLKQWDKTKLEWIVYPDDPILPYSPFRDTVEIGPCQM